MSPAAMLAGLAAPAAVVVALAPSGAWARWSFRRRRPGVLDHAGRQRWSGSGSSRHRSLVALWTALGPLVEACGGRLRQLVGRSSEPVADRRTGIAALVAVSTAVLVSPMVAVPVAAAAWAAPTMRSRSRRLARERAVRTALPDTVDLFRLAVGAGLSVHQAVDAVADHAPAPAGTSVSEVRRQVELGARMEDALDVLEELGDAALPLGSALRSAARYGSPLGPALERVAVDARMLRRRRAEEDARRLPVQLLFPLVLCVLPAFGLLAVVPLLLASLRSLQL